MLVARAQRGHYAPPPRGDGQPQDGTPRWRSGAVPARTRREFGARVLRPRRSWEQQSPVNRWAYGMTTMSESVSPYALAERRRGATWKQTTPTLPPDAKRPAPYIDSRG